MTRRDRYDPLSAFIESQVGSLRARADQLARYGATEVSTALKQAATDVEQAFRAWWLQGLSVADAAAESGYTAERLREMVREGRVAPTGDGKRLSIRRCDVPRKPRAAADDRIETLARQLKIA